MPDNFNNEQTEDRAGFIAKFIADPKFQAIWEEWDQERRALFMRIVVAARAARLDVWRINIDDQVRFGRKDPGSSRAKATLCLVNCTTNPSVTCGHDFGPLRRFRRRPLDEGVVSEVEAALKAQDDRFARLVGDPRRAALWPEDYPLEAPAYSFKVGRTYTRNDVFDLLAIERQAGGDWFTGYHQHKADWFIFCGVGAGGRTGHDYENYFENGRLVWYGKTQSRLAQDSIQSLLRPGGRNYLFYRSDDREPFTFGGASGRGALFR